MESHTIKVLMVGRVVQDGGLAELMSSADGSGSGDLYITASTFTVTWLHTAAVSSHEK